MGKKKKIEWLSILQGFSMLLVVVGHVDLYNKSYVASAPISSAIHRVIYSFHMPLFIFISGWLFYYTCMRKDKPYKEVLISKLKRLGIPFIAFTIIAMCMKLLIPQFMNRAVTSQELLNTFVFFRSNPLSGLWYVAVLLELMLLYPLYRLALKKPITTLLLLAFSIGLFFIQPSINYFYLNKVAHMLPFFVGGMICCKYSLHQYLDGWIGLIATCLLFVAFNVFEISPNLNHFVPICVGISFSFSLCIIVSRYIPRLFSSFRDYTFSIFLMSIFFQMPVRRFFISSGNDLLFVPLWFASVLIGIYAPTLIAKYINKSAPQAIKYCFGI